MAKTLLYRFFKVGKLPKPIRVNVSSQDVLIKDEGVNVFIHYHNFETGETKYKSKIVRAVGSICLTNWGIYAGIFSNVAMQISWKDPRVKNIIFEEKKGKFSMSFNAETFDSNAKGKVEYQFNCKNPQELINIILQQ